MLYRQKNAIRRYKKILVYLTDIAHIDNNKNKISVDRGGHIRNADIELLKIST